MFGWLGRKAMNSRISMCIQEVEWDVRDLSRKELALLQIYVGMWLVELSQKGFPISDLDDPISLGPNLADRLYKTLEDVRNMGVMDMEATKRRMQKLGMDTSGFDNSLELKLMRRSLELLMITLGVGLLPQKIYQVASIWRRSMKYESEDLDAAVAQICAERSASVGIEFGASHWSHGLRDHEIGALAGTLPRFAARTAASND